jgi:glycosyltransferase involved in cell wall biosynthesis
VAADTARALARRGHDVVVLAPRRADRPALERAGNLELRRSIRRGLLPQTFGDVVEAWRLARSEGRRFDVLVAHQNTIAVGFSAARIAVPLILVFHSSIPLEQRFRRRRLPIMQRIPNVALGPAFSGLERRAVRASAGILVLSEFSRAIVLGAYPAARDSVVKVSGGIDTSWFAPRAARLELRRTLGLEAATPLLVSVRRLDPRMGLEELLQAAALMQRDGLDFTLAIAGDGVLAGRLRALAEQLELSRTVRFLGRISEAQLRDLYAAADLSVLPTIAYEGFGMATIESLASGTPVVGTAVGATPELLEPLDPELIASSAEPAELATRIRRALERVDDRFRVRCASYAQSRFNWDHAILAWESALERVADGTAGHSTG